MRGTWQTTDGGGGAGPVLLVIGAVLLLGSGSAVAAVSEALVGAVIAVAVVTVLTAVAVGVFVVRRLRREIPSQQGFVRVLPGATPHELPGEQRPAIEQHVHFHFGPGSDPRAVDEILRRSQRPEQ